MNYSKWLEEANNTIAKLEVGVTFALKDLYKEVKWKKLTKGEMSQFGKYFKNEVLEGNIKGVKFIENNKNATKYKKVR